MIERRIVDHVNIRVIDYSDEPGPFWYVVVDDTPLFPEEPLPLDLAVEEFKTAAMEASEDTTVELRQCTAEDLKFANVVPAER